MPLGLTRTVGNISESTTTSIYPRYVRHLKAFRGRSVLKENRDTEMVEPLEDTRTELVFATEPVLSSLEHAIPGSGKHASLVELDEVEVCSYVPIKR